MPTNRNLGASSGSSDTEKYPIKDNLTHLTETNIGGFFACVKSFVEFISIRGSTNVILVAALGVFGTQGGWCAS